MTNGETASHFQTTKYFREFSKDHRHNLQLLPEEWMQTDLVQEETKYKYRLSVRGMQYTQLFRNTQLTKPESISHKSKRAKKFSAKNYLLEFGEVLAGLDDCYFFFFFLSEQVMCQKYSSSSPEIVHEFRTK